MISVIIYGRNDSHGYNLPRRAALSLNCIAEVLTDPDDEILFVDYNTPDNYPTFIESIDDTLTEKAKKILKIIRVPSSIHARYKDLTHLVVSEPLARNIALRRSNSNNRWILSTNSDMIFVPRKNQVSLSDIAKNLPDGSYCTPRFELPEALWECLDRKTPKQTIETVSQWAKNLNLNFILHREPWVLYDGPGDFQLMLRDQLFQINGFDESMLLGWHVDSNIAKRLFLINGETKPLVDEIYGYHCMHTRTETNAHKHNAKSNDLTKYVYEINDPYLPNQSTVWGLPDIEFETILLSNLKAHNNLNALQKIMYPNSLEYYEFPVDHYYSLHYPSKHVLPYLSSILVTYPKDTIITYFGLHKYISEPLEKLLSNLEMKFFSVVEESNFSKKNILNEFYNKSNVLIFDLGFDSNQRDIPHQLIPEIISVFYEMVKKNSNDFSNVKYFVVINAKETMFEKFIKTLIRCNDSPFSSFCLMGTPFQNLKIKDVFKLREKKIEEFNNLYGVFRKTEFYRYNHYRFNDVIYFNQSHNNIHGCQDQNWFRMEKKGTWTLGKKASISLTLKEIPKQDVTVKILLKPYLRPGHLKQELELMINDLSISKWQFKHRLLNFKRMIPKRYITAVIPKSAIIDQKLKIDFNISYPAGDEKGFRIYEMTFLV